MWKQKIHMCRSVSSSPRVTCTKSQSMRAALREKVHNNQLLARRAHTCLLLVIVQGRLPSKHKEKIEVKRVQRVCVAHSELSNGIKHFTLTNAGDVRVIRDSCCVSRGLSLVQEYIFHNAIVKTTLDEQ